MRFAEFNAALNGLTNVRVLEGDVYAPLGDEHFDVVIAHPPYVPALETEFVFRDAGEDGEQVTRRIVDGLACIILLPGGQFFCDCMLTDREGATLEQRCGRCWRLLERRASMSLSSRAAGSIRCTSSRTRRRRATRRSSGSPC